MGDSIDAIVIGSGPNGFAAAITLAKAGLSVVMFEAKATIGGGMRSLALTLPDFVHDVCSAIHPLAFSSPFFKTLPLNLFGLEWINPTFPLVHPLDGGSGVLMAKSIELTASLLGIDEKAYLSFMRPLVKNWEHTGKEVLAPLHFPRYPWKLAQFACKGFQSAKRVWEKAFKDLPAKSLFSGLAAHSLMPLDKPLTSAFGLVLAIQAHKYGWPFPKGGAQKLADALAAYFLSLGGKIETNCEVKSLNDLPDTKLILCDITPKQLVKIAKNRLPHSYQLRLEKFRYGPGVFKIDWALNEPIPWTYEQAKQAGTLHLGGSYHEIEGAEKAVWKNQHPQKPFVLLAQQSLFDSTRAPEGKQTVWGYCHVPGKSTVDMTEAIENQIERFAPGFKDCILAKSQKNAVEIEAYNPNYVGGDINGGVQDLFQLLSRPVSLLSPYSTPVKGLYLCSSSTPPGGGVHGMCGYYAAVQALKDLK